MPEGPYKNIMSNICTSLESTLGIVCACIVVMRPLFGKIFPDRLRFNKATNRLSTVPSTTSDFRLSRTPGWTRPKMPSRGLSGNRTESQQALAPRRFQRLEDIYPFPPGEGLTNTTTVEVGTAARAYGGDHESQTQLPQRSLSPSSIIVRKEWSIDSRVA